MIRFIFSILSQKAVRSILLQAAQALAAKTKNTCDDELVQAVDALIKKLEL